MGALLCNFRDITCKFSYGKYTYYGRLPTFPITVHTGCKLSQFYSLGKLKPVCSCPKVILTSPKTFF